MKKSISTLLLIVFCLVAKGQFMLGKGIDDILNKYQNDKAFRLTVLRTPKGTVIPKLKITATVQMRDTGDSENSLITYIDIKTDELYTFYLINNRCVTFEHSYNISKLPKTKDKLDKMYTPNYASGIDNHKWVSSDGLITISLIPYESLHTFDVQYSIN
jgi:hypothetical protein